MYGWAVHYFQEDSIEGTLFNADGTEYKPTPKPTPAQVRKVEVKKPEQRQPSLFDFMEPEASEPEVKDENGDDEDEQPSQEEIDEILAEIAEEEKADTQPEKPVSPIWQKYQKLQKEHSDRILLYRLGDFYEVFGDNAVILSDTRFNPYRQRFRAYKPRTDDWLSLSCSRQLSTKNNSKAQSRHHRNAR